MATKLRLITHEPITPIEHLAARAKEWLHLPPEDLDAFYTLMGAVAGNMVAGEPCWLMLVSPPSTGKTELVNSLLQLPGVFECANPTGESSFLSGTSKKEKTKDSTGGVLRQVGSHGALIINDLTSILSKDVNKAKEILAALRECYAGRWSRPVGSDGGKVLQWTGKLAVFGGCTGEIDQFHRVTSVMGERWLYFRMKDEESARWAKGKKALENEVKKEWRDALRTSVVMFFESLELCYGKVGDRRPLTELEMVRVLRLAAIAARCRSGVSRDWFSRDKEIIGVPERESEARIATALAQLYIGLELIGIEDERDRWRLIGRVGFDSMPKVRRIIVEAVRAHHNRGGVTQEELVKKCKGVGRGTVERSVEELEVHGCVVRKKLEEGKKATVVVLSEWLKAEWDKGWGQVRS